MRVNSKNLSSSSDKIKSKKSGVKKPDSTKENFKTQLTQIQQNEVKKRLDKLLDLVDREGQKLKNSLDKKDLISYKRRVQDFLRILQQEFVQAKQSVSWDGAGNVQTYTIIEQVDQNLGVLQNLFLQDQSDVLEIVSKIDEIRGLLLDLYR